MTLLVVLCVGHTIGTDDLDANKRAQNLAQVVRGLGPAPRVLGISADNEVAFPVTRLVKGTFVQRQPFLWMAASAARIQSLTPETQWRNELYTRYYALEREILIEDITKGKPDVILIDIPEWAVLSRFMLDARLAELLSRYRQIATVDDVAVYALKP